MYLAVLKKGEPSPLLPESDEERACPRLRRGRPADGAERRVATAPVTVQIDFDRIQQRILAVPGVPSRVSATAAAGAAGTVYFLEAPSSPERAAARCIASA